MNSLIARLAKENNLTEKRLKQVFRQLCKSAHPDAAGGKGERFIGLRKEYEEALELVRSTPHAAPPLSGPALREKLLATLHRYAMKEMTKEGEKLLGSLIALSSSYDPPLAECWRQYRERFFKTYSSWVSDGEVYYTHGLFIALVKQFFYYRTAYTARHRTLFFRYAEDFERRAKKLDAERAAALEGIARWLEREIGRPNKTNHE